MGQPEHIFITRHRHDESRKYWDLRFRHESRVIHRERFTDREYGSKEKSLQAALTTRDEIAKILKIDLQEYWHDCKIKKYRYTHKVPNPNHKHWTGVPGVRYVPPKPGTNQSGFYIASYCYEKYKPKSKSFSCAVYGKELAFRCAVQWRKKKERELCQRRKK